MEWARKRQERLDYINNQIMKQCKAEKRFMDLNSAMQIKAVTSCSTHKIDQQETDG